MPFPPALANGFQVRTGDADWVGNAFAGMAAKGQDAGTAWANPAAMVRLNDSQIDLGLSGVFPSVRFNGQDRLGQGVVRGSNGNDAGAAALVPGFAAVWRASSKLRFGFAVEAPFGQRIVYPSDFVGRYQAEVSSISDIELAPSIAYQVTPQLGLAAGPIIDVFSARLTNALDIGPAASLTGDPAVDLHGSDVSLGYHFGIFWEPKPGYRFGLDYRSRLNEDISGSQKIFVPPGLAVLSPATAAGLRMLETPARAKLTLPDVLTLSTALQVSPQLTLLGTVQWTNWAVIQQIVVAGSNGLTTTLPLRLRSSWMGSIGADYHPHWCPGLTLQGGVGFDETPVTSEARTPRLPNQSAILLAAGASYELTAMTRIKAAFLHEFGVGSSGISYSAAPSAGTLVGHFQTGVSVVSTGISVGF